ncbi:MAG: hypothetical protein KJ614_14055 [Gammaproteobacteria bacterium]|uniref:hypothetical protein n=1 Tax=Rhodoferax sp. TaxID=50421 RepID=UPI0017E98BB9|nr:hypothetical protein [Rhodoferax sp.]MBU3900020.1 hypothetical protein [Gammaproteobacteria bacterium]MBA3059329.1 hypothetical protein [Rhodoferax sp.]MBU3999384.1 hypothetical protein [Gammaproteobacteria bacterium]MBU4082058.1 hypothetical protein [Gammaproteobacteria bacterium]MBU4115361.1 hypothetical protein [Gammaproteobacteria bacterium]
MKTALETLNMRIARLAIALDVALDNEAEVASLMGEEHDTTVLHERRVSAHAVDAAQAHSGPECRVAHQRQELRGLLVMRYEVEKRYVNDAGITVTHQIMIEAEQQLQRKGFKPGVDGINLERLFNT